MTSSAWVASRFRVSHRAEWRVGAYRQLRVWQGAHELAREVYTLVREWRSDDRFVLGDQLRRACTSIGANIAEGCGRDGDRELARYLAIALGSANELHYLLQLTRDSGVGDAARIDPLIIRAEAVCRMLAGLRSAVLGGKRPPVLRREPGPLGSAVSGRPGTRNENAPG